MFPWVDKIGYLDEKSVYTDPKLSHTRILVGKKSKGIDDPKVRRLDDSYIHSLDSRNKRLYDKLDSIFASNDYNDITFLIGGSYDLDFYQFALNNIKK